MKDKKNHQSNTYYIHTLTLIHPQGTHTYKPSHLLVGNWTYLFPAGLMPRHCRSQLKHMLQAHMRYGRGVGLVRNRKADTRCHADRKKCAFVALCVQAKARTMGSTQELLEASAARLLVC